MENWLPKMNEVKQYGFKRHVSRSVEIPPALPLSDKTNALEVRANNLFVENDRCEEVKDAINVFKQDFEVEDKVNLDAAWFAGKKKVLTSTDVALLLKRGTPQDITLLTTCLKSDLKLGLYFAFDSKLIQSHESYQWFAEFGFVPFNQTNMLVVVAEKGKVIQSVLKQMRPISINTEESHSLSGPQLVSPKEWLPRRHTPSPSKISEKRVTPLGFATDEHRRKYRNNGSPSSPDESGSVDSSRPSSVSVAKFSQSPIIGLTGSYDGGDSTTLRKQLSNLDLRNSSSNSANNSGNTFFGGFSNLLSPNSIRNGSSAFIDEHTTAYNDLDVVDSRSCTSPIHALSRPGSDGMFHYDRGSTPPPVMMSSSSSDISIGVGAKGIAQTNRYNTSSHLDFGTNANTRLHRSKTEPTMMLCAETPIAEKFKHLSQPSPTHYYQTPLVVPHRMFRPGSWLKSTTAPQDVILKLKSQLLQSQFKINVRDENHGSLKSSMSDIDSISNNLICKRYSSDPNIVGGRNPKIPSPNNNVFFSSIYNFFSSSQRSSTSSGSKVTSRSQSLPENEEVTAYKPEYLRDLPTKTCPSSDHCVKDLFGGMKLKGPKDMENLRDRKRRARVSRMSSLGRANSLDNEDNKDSTPAGKLKRIKKELLSSASKSNHVDLDLSISFCINQSIIERSHNSSLSPLANASSSSEEEVMVGVLNEKNFGGTIVGGIYENCFESNGIPVVSPPSHNDKRVVCVEKKESSGDLEITVFNPRLKAKNQLYTILLNCPWYCLKASPNGFLVCSKPFLPHKAYHCYYLHKNPLVWAEEASVKSPESYSHVSNDVNSLRKMCNASHDTLFASTPPQNYLYDHSHGSGESILRGGKLMCRLASMETSTDYSASPIFSQRVLNQEGKIDQDQSADNIAIKFDMDMEVSDDENTVDDFKLSIGCSEDIWERRVMEGQVKERSDMMETDSKGNENDEKENYEVVEQSKNNDCCDLDANHPSLVRLVIPFLLGDDCKYDGYCYLVSISKIWALEVYRYHASLTSKTIISEYYRPRDAKHWQKFMLNYPNGIYLGEGSCKKVYCVQNVSYSKCAISVMNINELTARGVGAAIGNEIEISIVASSLVSLNITPNLIKIYSTFQSMYPPSDNSWNALFFPQQQQQQLVQKGRGKANSKNKSNNLIVNLKASGRYQYILMEYCPGGDMESMVRGRGQLASQDIVTYLFQMCFSLFVCRDQLSLRHYDIKLLNFFLTNYTAITNIESVGQQHDRLESKPNTDVDTLVMNIYFGAYVFSIPLDKRQHHCGIVKLADFGTSSIGTMSLGCPITVNQFTTLENTPPEFLFLGSMARESVSADTFCLGLSFLHLLTGSEPYEVLMKDVRCPRYLKDLLSKIWKTMDPENPYYVITQVMASLSGDDVASVVKDSDSDVLSSLLYDTLYRYVVLTGFPKCTIDALDNEEINTFGGQDSFASSNQIPFGSMNLVWMALQDALEGQRDDKNAKITRAMEKARSFCMNQYLCDSALWRISSGESGHMARVRAHLLTLGNGSASILARMLHLDPTQRCTLHEVIQSPLFFSIRRFIGSDSTATYEQQLQCSYPNIKEISNFTYYKNRMITSDTQRIVDFQNDHGVLEDLLCPPYI